jgi:hypothetical protein
MKYSSRKIIVWFLGLTISIYILSLVLFSGQKHIETNKSLEESKISTFLSKIPIFLEAQFYNNNLINEQGRFEGLSGFSGDTNKDKVYLILSRFDGIENESVVELVDLRTFKVEKLWRLNQEVIPVLHKYLNKTLFTQMPNLTHPFLTNEGDLIIKDGGPLIKIGEEGNLIWSNSETIFHHSIEQNYEKDFWVPSRIYLDYSSNSKLIGIDAITKISPEGKILYQKKVNDILSDNDIDFKLTEGGQYLLDPFEMNDIQPVLFSGPYWNLGDIFISLKKPSMVILYRPETNQIIWKTEGKTFFQHDIDIINEHTISIFNNNIVSNTENSSPKRNNQVIIYDFEKDEFSKYMNESLENNDVRTRTEGLIQILPNGDLFIEEQNHGRVLYFNRNQSLRWQFINRSNNGKIYKLNWSRILYKPEDIKKVDRILNQLN